MPYTKTLYVLSDEHGAPVVAAPACPDKFKVNWLHKWFEDACDEGRFEQIGLSRDLEPRLNSALLRSKHNIKDTTYGFDKASQDYPLAIAFFDSYPDEIGAAIYKAKWKLSKGDYQLGSEEFNCFIRKAIDLAILSCRVCWKGVVNYKGTRMFNRTDSMKDFDSLRDRNQKYVSKSHVKCDRAKSRAEITFESGETFVETEWDAFIEKNLWNREDKLAPFCVKPSHRGSREVFEQEEIPQINFYLSGNIDLSDYFEKKVSSELESYRKIQAPRDSELPPELKASVQAELEASLEKLHRPIEGYSYPNSGGASGSWVEAQKKANQEAADKTMAYLLSCQPAPHGRCPHDNWPLEKRGVGLSAGKAAVGGALLGPVGAVIGASMGKTQYYCPHCGYVR